jgi:uncharacterized protein (DUF362 family)
MNRRQFIKCCGMGLLSLSLAGCSMKDIWKKGSLDNVSNGTGEKLASGTVAYDRTKLIVVQGTDPKALINTGFEALGGSEGFIKSGATVVIKPNFSVPRTPEEAAVTNPLLVAALVTTCLNAGAKVVKVIDHPFTNGAMCLETTGMKKIVEAVGGKVFLLSEQSDRFYKSVDVGGQVLKTVQYSKDVLEADTFINFPILKHHNGTKITMGLKNMMGLVWDRGIFHRTNLQQCIAELAHFHQPDLTILDATRGIIDNGPMGPGTIREYNEVVFGTDPVAVDAYGAQLFGLNPADLGYLVAASKLGLGEINIQKLTVARV